MLAMRATRRGGQQHEADREHRRQVEQLGDREGDHHEHDRLHQQADDHGARKLHDAGEVRRRQGEAEPEHDHADSGRQQDGGDERRVQCFSLSDPGPARSPHDTSASVTAAKASCSRATWVSVVAGHASIMLWNGAMRQPRFSSARWIACSSARGVCCLCLRAVTQGAGCANEFHACADAHDVPGQPARSDRRLQAVSAAVRPVAPCAGRRPGVMTCSSVARIAASASAFAAQRGAHAGVTRRRLCPHCVQAAGHVVGEAPDTGRDAAGDGFAQHEQVGLEPMERACIRPDRSRSCAFHRSAAACRSRASGA